MSLWKENTNLSIQPDLFSSGYKSILKGFFSIVSDMIKNHASEN